MRRLAGLLFWFLLFAFFWGAATGGGSPERLAELVRREWPGATEAVVAKASAVSGCEAGHSNKMGDEALMDAKWGPSLGPFQIRTLWAHLPHFSRFVDGAPNRNPILMMVPSFNAQAAYDISESGRNWGPWTCGRST